MASLNSVTILGNLTRDVELRYTSGGTAVASMCIATNERFKAKSGEWEDRPEFHNVTLWGKQGESAATHLSKGQSCLVTGRLQTRKWQDKENRDRYTTEIVGEKVLFLGSKGDKASPQGQQSQGQYEEQRFPDDSEIPF